MTNYRILLVLTAVCSALVTAVFIDPNKSNGFIEPVQILSPSTFIPTPDTTDNEVIEIKEPLTLAIKICTDNKCEDLVISGLDNFLIVENGPATENEQYHRVVPYQLPQHGVPIIEM